MNMKILFACQHANGILMFMQEHEECEGQQSYTFEIAALHNYII